MSRLTTRCCENLYTRLVSPPAAIVAVLWLIVAIWAWLWLGPIWIMALRPAPDQITDFYQDWGSARNYVLGLPVYTRHTISIPRHLGIPANRQQNIEYNAHPPVAVLLTLPLAGLAYPDAVLAWNLLSLAALIASLKIVANELGFRWNMLPPTLALLAFCHPIYGNLYLGQLTLVLVLLVTVIWTLERSGRSDIAGLVIGIAAAIKLFPGYLILFYLARGRVRPFCLAGLSFFVLSVLAALVLGLDTYYDYVQIVIPAQAKFWSCGYNLSIAGFWHKLFSPLAEAAIEPLWFSPALARWGTVLSDLAVTFIVVISAYRAQTLPQRDLALAITMTAMLLVSPVAWDFSLPLLLVPIAMIIRWPGTLKSCWILPILVLVLSIAWIPQNSLTSLTQVSPSRCTFSWMFMLGAPSLKFYGLLGMFALELAVFHAEMKDSVTLRKLGLPTPSSAGLGFASSALYN
jgi:hypothetical protein